MHKLSPTRPPDSSLPAPFIAPLNPQPLYDLFEMDWVCIGEYLDGPHSSILCLFSSSAQGAVWNLESKLKGVPWVVLLHNESYKSQMMAAEYVRDGTCVS